jgi:hypothetical protein
MTARSVWWSEFRKQLKKTGNTKLSAERADRIVRKTQSMMLPKDMPEFMQRHSVMKLLTPFFSNFSTLGNQWGEIFRGLKTKRKTPLDALIAMFWLFLSPSIYDTFVKSAGTADNKEYINGLMGFASTPIPLFRDYVSYQVQGFSGMTLFTRWFKEIFEPLFKATKYDDLGDAGKDVIESAGILVGRGKFPAMVVARAYEGFYDLLTGETDDPRRVIWSKYALKE